MVTSAHDLHHPTAFSEQGFSDPYPDGIERHYWTVARNRTIHRTIQEAVSFAKPSLVVDVGCGRGITLDYLYERGMEVLGCELGRANPISTRIAPHLHFDTDAVSLPQETRRNVGVLLLLDVLEHLPSPSSFLDGLVDAFEKVHTIIVTVPARQELWSNYDEHYGHYKRYDFENACELFNPARFEIRRQSYLFRSLYWPALMLKWIGRGRATSIAAPTGASVAVHGLMARWLELESRLLPSVVPGTSLMMVLKPKPVLT
jgi:hypothetical protein